MAGGRDHQAIDLGGRRVVGVAGLEPVEPKGGQDHALDQAAARSPTRASVRPVGDRPAERASRRSGRPRRPKGRRRRAGAPGPAPRAFRGRRRAPRRSSLGAQQGQLAKRGAHVVGARRPTGGRPGAHPPRRVPRPRGRRRSRPAARLSPPRARSASLDGIEHRPIGGSAAITSIGWASHAAPAARSRRKAQAQMSQSVILGTARTPFGKMGGGLASLDATDLGGQAIASALERSEVEPGQVEAVIYGQVLQAGQGQIPSRQAQIKAGIPSEVPSETINKVCASGMRAIGLADQAVRAGDSSLAVTGGMESMSQAPYLLPGARFGFRMGDVKAIDSMTHDGLTNPFTEQADDQRGLRGLQRARDHPRGHGPVCRPLAPARGQGDRRGPARRGDRDRHRQAQEGRGRGRGRRGDPTGDDGGGAREAPAGRRRRCDPHRRQLPRRQRRRGRGRPRLRGVGRARGPHADRSSARLRGRGGRLRLPGAHPREGRQAGAGQDREVARRTSTSGRSTRHSPRWRSTRCGCSASTTKR